MPETTPLIKAALNLRVGAGFDVYGEYVINTATLCQILLELKKSPKTQCFRGNLLFCDIRLNYLFENQI